MYPREFKQQVIKETLEPGASVSIVARRHDMNANNVVFEWRKQYRKGKLVLPDSNEVPPSRVDAAQLFAVDVIDMSMPTPRALPGMASAPSKAADSVSAPLVCEIEIEIGKRRVRIRGLPAERAEMFLQECLK